MIQLHRQPSTSDPPPLEHAHTEPSAAPTVTVVHSDATPTGFADIYDELTPRQVGIMTIGSAIGTGLMIGTGRALSISGPAAVIISYTVVGFTAYLVLSALGEVAAWLPKPYTVADQAVRFCDPALGFSLAWIFWLKYAVVTPNQLTAATLVVSYWLDAERVNPGIWVTCFLVIITALNFLCRGLASKMEFYVSCFKIVMMSGLMLLALVIALGGGPDHDRKGFRYWKSPGAFGPPNENRLIEKFYMTCGTISSAMFAYIGSERTGVMAQTPCLHKATSRAIKYTFYRILVFHLLGITLLGMIVPHNSVTLAFHSASSKDAAASPFVAAIYLAGISVLPDILNACILMCTLSIANYDLYLAAKAMCDLALKDRAPAFLSRTNRRGIPIYALGVCCAVTTLAYLNIGHDSTAVFGYFVNSVTMLGLLTWISILITHISFVRARKAQGVPDEALICKARFGLPGTLLALILCLFISVTMVVDSFQFEAGRRHFNYKSFVASYLGIPLYLILIVGYKLTIKTKHVAPREADLWTDKSVGSGGRRD
ncbi:uncharacterized protein PFLUO_LOCUS5657 [Penicillium psychrofluorescens]|uniref:uncharacterized protein n=1 Tax=Penicillium psychrofluorescens TaxID=3158075 RepID=UPI003CCCE053